jgi:prepilin-type processing-associated H-X9-DG protein
MTKLENVTDGTSSTLMFGETLGGNPNGLGQGQRDYALLWIGSGAFPTGYGFSSTPNWWNFSSRHSGIINFCYADGSVHAVSTGVNTRTLRSAAGKADGEVYDQTNGF